MMVKIIIIKFIIFNLEHKHLLLMNLMLFGQNDENPIPLGESSSSSTFKSKSFLPMHKVGLEL